MNSPNKEGMTYELAKKLKDAGFPQNGFDKEPLTWQEKHHAYFPALSELIEACGAEFKELMRVPHPHLDKNPWYCRGWETEIFEGSTPEEAVANLWLALNNKTNKQM